MPLYWDHPDPPTGVAMQPHDALAQALTWIQQAMAPACQHEWMRPTRVDDKIVVMCFKCGRVSQGVPND